MHKLVNEEMTTTKGLHFDVDSSDDEGYGRRHDYISRKSMTGFDKKLSDLQFKSLAGQVVAKYL